MLNKILNKKLFIGVLLTTALLMAVGINYAVGVDGPKVQELTLQGAVDLAMKNSTDIQLADLDIKKKEIEYDTAVSAANRIDLDKVNRGVLENGDPMPLSMQYGNSVTYWVAPKAAEVKLAVAKKNKELTLNKVKYNVENAYYNVLKSERNLAIKRENLKYFQDQLKIAQTGYKIGTRAKVDVTIVEAAVASYQALVTGEENKYRGAMIELNRIIGLDLDTPLKLVTKFNVEKSAAKIDVNDTIKDALENNVAIYSLKRNVEVTKAQGDAIKKFYDGAPVANTTEIDIKSAEVNVKATELALTSLIKQSYLSLHSLEQVIDWQTKDVEKNKENVKVFNLKYEAGLATALDVKKATIDLEQSEESLSESIYQYNLLKAQFKYDLFLSGSGGGSGSYGQ